MATYTGNGSVVSAYQLVLTVTQSSQSIDGNYSNIDWNIQIKNSSSSYNFSLYTSTITAVINGVTVYSNTSQRSVGKNATVNIASGSLTVAHNTDGSKSIGCSCSYSERSPASYTAGNMSCSGTMALSTIPRASSFSMSTNFTLGDSIPIAITRASSSFTHKILLAFGNYSTTLTSSAATSYTWATSSFLSTMANQIPSASSGVGQITVETYNGSTKIGSASKTFTTTLASTVIPTCGAITLAEANSVVSALSAGYIKGYSKLKITIGTSSSVYGATIASYKITANNQTFDTQTATTSALGTAGSNTITVSVTDTRGRTASKTTTITVVDYSAPNINVTAVRKTTTPTTVTVAITGSITSLSNKNSSAYTIKSKLRTATSYTSKATNVAISGTAINISRDVTSYVISSSYDVQVIVTDKISSTTVQLVVPTDSTLLDISKSGVGIGKYRENGVFEIAGNLQNCYFDGKSFLDVIYPIGSIYMAVNSTNPSTFLGGTWVTWGSGRVPVGVDTGQTEFNTVGKTGGTKTHTLSTSEMPKHNHGITGDPLYADINKGTPQYFYVASTSGMWWIYNRATVGTASTGGSQAHNNLQPFITCYMWKRTK